MGTNVLQKNGVSKPIRKRNALKQRIHNHMQIYCGVYSVPREICFSSVNFYKTANLPFLSILAIKTTFVL